MTLMNKEALLHRFLVGIVFLLAGCAALRVTASPLPQSVREWKLPNGVQAVAFLPDSQTLLAGGGFCLGPGRLFAWDCRTGKRLIERKDHRMSIRGVAASPDGKLVASAGQAGEVKLWSAPSLKLLADFDGGCESPRAPGFSPDSKLLATAGDKVVKVWDMKTLKEVASMPARWGNSFGGALAFSPDGKTLAAQDFTVIRLWDMDGFKERPCLYTHQDYMVAVAFSPDGKLLAAGGGTEDCRLRLWETASRKEIAAYEGHTDSILSVAFTPDGRFVITGSCDHTVRIWEVATGKEVIMLNAHKSCVRSLAVSADGRLLATCGDDHLVKLWDLAHILPPDPNK